MTITKIDTKNLNYEQWLEQRQKYIGGSDAGAIVGLNPWKSQLSVYLEKTNQKENKNKDNEQMRIGRDLEEYVAKRFEESTGKKVRRNNFMMIKDGIFSANVDREVVGENAVLECKTTNSFALKDWQGDSIPVHYELQCHHYMMVGGYDRAYIAVLIGNSKFIWKEIPRDEEMIKLLEEQESKFWNDYVLQRQMPPADGSDTYSNALKEKYQGGLEEAIEIDIEDEQLELLESLKSRKKEIDISIKKIEQEIQSQMKDNEIGILDGYKVTWKSATRKTIDTKKLNEENPDIYNKYLKETNYRTFKINKL